MLHSLQEHQEPRCNERRTMPMSKIPYHFSNNFTQIRNSSPASIRQHSSRKPNLKTNKQQFTENRSIHHRFSHFKESRNQI
ncbi:hypothetical protein CDL12_09613 [Handroanthus impetiginosus]|uniref:Uncharacterized protein n=1 Tax=Handroanthus impetiginosus TaxID=429701 RepID=A0A2G9HJL8_9LAMI|nr:hypothetical protein CDL12_09613 [Handroanthus impetiginosus]